MGFCGNLLFGETGCIFQLVNYLDLQPVIIILEAY
jgi:hypothetical protein